MFVLMKIALRNVFAHKAKTLIVGSLIFVGVFLLILGNSFLDSAGKGIQKAYSDSVTGEIAILKSIDFDFSLFGTWNNIGNLSVPAAPDLEDTLELLKKYPGVRKVTTLSSDILIVNNGEANPDFWIMRMAVDPESYRSFFDLGDTLIIKEGRFLDKGEEGIVISAYTADYLKKYKNLDIHPGDSMLLNGYSAKGFRIREVPVRGIYEYRYVKGDMYPMLPRTCFIDQQNFNALNGFATTEEKTPPPAEADDLVFSDSMDELFSDTVVTGSSSASVQTDLDELLGDMSARHSLSAGNSSDWQWILLSLENRDDKTVKQFRKDLEGVFRDRFSRFESDEILKPGEICASLLDPPSAEYAHLASFLSIGERIKLEKFSSTGNGEALAGELAALFTSWLERDDLYDGAAFDGIFFSSITEHLTEKKQKGFDLVRRNRLVLEELYPYSVSRGPDYMVSEWWHAAAPMSTTTMGLKAVMNIALIIIFTVAVIIIMNTLIISVMERTGEIGTIRAMGGQKSFIFSLFTGETMAISFIFGVLGMAAGAFVIILLGRAGIPATEGSMLQMIAGGNTIYPALSPWTVGSSLLFMAVVGLLSSLYPVFFAMKIQPVEAMRNG